jgi:hypothetical protein
MKKMLIAVTAMAFTLGAFAQTSAPATTTKKEAKPAATAAPAKTEKAAPAKTEKAAPAAKSEGSEHKSASGTQHSSAHKKAAVKPAAGTTAPAPEKK